MSLLDYFIGRRKPKTKPAQGDPTRIPIPLPIVRPIPVPIAVPLLKARPPVPVERSKPTPRRTVSARSEIQSLGNVTSMFQREAYAWQAAANHLAEIVADAIMPDATDDERHAYAREIAFEIMKTELAHYERTIG